jgi:hypothetical protein
MRESRPLPSLPLTKLLTTNTVLSTRNMLDRLQAIAEDNFNHASSLYDSPSIFPSSPHTYTDRDRALMAILSSLRTLPFARHARGNWYPQGLATKNDSLVLYKHTAAHGVKQTSISLSEFVDKAQTWLCIRNPACVSGDFPNAKNSWHDIATSLRNSSVDISKIDMKLYTELTTVLEGEGLTSRMNDIVLWAKNGQLEERWKAWLKHTEAKKKITHAGNTDIATRADGLYSKRFTHKHPLGRPRSLISEDEKAERKADRIAKATREAAAAATAAANRERNTSARGGLLGCVKGRADSRKRRSMVLFVMFIVVLFGALLGAMLWAMATNRLDFTAGGEGF